MKNVEEAIAENAKGILASTMKEEINQLVKESLSEQDEEEDEIEIDAATAPSLGDEGDAADNEDMGMNIDMDMNIDSDSPIDLTDATDEEILKVFKAMGEDDGIIVKKDGNEIHLSDDNNDVEYLVKLGESEEDYETMNEMDDADESVDDVIAAIFDGDMSGIDSSNYGTEMEEQEDDFEEEEEIVYEISLDEDDEEELDEEMDEEMYEEEDMYEEENMSEEEDMYEGEDLDEEYFTNESKSSVKPKGVGMGKGPKFSYDNKAKGGFDEDKKEGPKSVGTGKASKFQYKKGANMEGKSKVVKAETKEGDYGMNKGDKSKTHKGDEDYTTKKGDTLKRKAFEKEETKEAARTYGMGSKEGRGLRKGITNNRNFVYGNNGVTVESLEAEVSMLREKNEEYRKALNVFREKLTEVAIFNSNLAYATRLFTEHSTTKKEKINILRRFDDVDSLKESKGLYKSIKEELTKVDSKSINESVGQKINNTVSTGSSTTLIESKTYENPQFMRMKDLMSKLQ